ncbi:unnamed protein product [Durusdinium trenchii]|uniref:Uncharacterized protein n=2 Tax=Durusdinium trenchii TaxID=1381693 RepID=A0ABP0P757_9DINO
MKWALHLRSQASESHSGATPQSVTMARPLRLRILWVVSLGIILLQAGRGFIHGCSSCSKSTSPRTQQSAVKEEVETTAETGIGTDPTGVVSVPTGGVDKSQLLREITSNTPGLTRSTSPRSEGGGVRLLFAPEPHESVTFALWFGPLPCFQVGTFRYCFCLSQTMVLTGFLLALAVVVMGPEILMPPRYG